jgi:hypothetical protein
MLKNKQINIGDKSFQLNPLPALRALKLDKKVVTMIIPVFKGFEGLDQEINLGAAIEAVSEALLKLEDNEYEKFILDILSTVQYLPSGKAPIEIDSDVINNQFSGEIMSIYRLIFEVMKYNRFSPFEMVGDGNEMMKILFSGFQKQSGKDSNQESETLES